MFAIQGISSVELAADFLGKQCVIVLILRPVGIGFQATRDGVFPIEIHPIKPVFVTELNTGGRKLGPRGLGKGNV